MTVMRISGLEWTGLSADSKPTGVANGTYYWAYDTDIMYRTYDGTNYVPCGVSSITQPSDETLDFQQAVADYPLYTATGGSVFVESFTLTNTTNHSADAGAFTGMSVITTGGVTLVAQAAGVKAQLTAGKVFTYSTPFAMLVGDIMNYHVYGGASTAAGAFVVSIRYRPINPVGYIA